MPFDPFAQFRMTDHVALITGGAQNIGHHCPPWRKLPAKVGPGHPHERRESFRRVDQVARQSTSSRASELSAGPG